MDTRDEHIKAARLKHQRQDPLHSTATDFSGSSNDTTPIGSSDLHRKLLREMSSGVVVYRAVDNGDDFVIMDLNRAAEMIEQVTREQVAGRRVTHVFPGVAAFGLLGVFKSVWESGTPQHHPVSEYSDHRIRGWRENRVFRLTSGEIVAVYDDRTRQVEIEQAEAHHELLANELNHRLLNARHVVELIVRESMQDDPVRASIINQRIRAGLAGLEIHGRAATKPIAVRALLANELAPFGLDRIALYGVKRPLLPARLRPVVALAAHELATNAAKYGAFSNGDGRVTLKWRIDQETIKLSWNEDGGPPVTSPQTSGYGSEMLHRLIHAAGGTIKRAFRTEGLGAEILLPVNGSGLSAAFATAPSSRRSEHRKSGRAGFERLPGPEAGAAAER